jgi:SAM-dependent methyltransferase
MKCRICGSERANELGRVEYYSGFDWPIFECTECGCRFTPHEENVYERLHVNSNSRYGEYWEASKRCKAAFDRRDSGALRDELSRVSKYRFVIDRVSELTTPVQLLEIGCSRGYLTSYFILTGLSILGTDVSQSALDGARTAFGNHFALADSPEIASRAPYDVVYHTGMIGCVADPLGLTRKLLDMLKPGGILLFNAPNVESCCLPGQLWIDFAPPPDVVTVFRPGFWRRYFSEAGEVREDIEVCDENRSTTGALRWVCRRAWRKPEPKPLDGRESTKATEPPPFNYPWGRRWHLFERSVVKVAIATKIACLVPRQPSEFGMFVTIRKSR